MSFCIDDTFKLTQNLINIYPVFLQTFLKNSTEFQPSTNAISQSSNPYHSSSNARLRDNVNQISGSNFPRTTEYTQSTGISHSNVYLLVSCHTGLIEIYDELFVHMIRTIANMSITDDCLQSPSPSKNGQGRSGPSKSGAQDFTMLIRLTSQLLDLADQLVVRLQTITKLQKNEGLLYEADGVAASTSLPAARALQKRALGMSEKLREIKLALYALGFPSPCSCSSEPCNH